MLASSVAVALGSCAPGTTDVADTEASDSAIATDLTVVTTILPITQFTNAVVGDRAEVIPLMPTNVSPHDFQASPADVQALVNADVLVKNGLEMELFLEDMIANAENPDLVMIDSSEGIAVISNEAVEGQSGGKADDHNHDHAEEDHDDEHNATAADADHAEAGHHDHGEFNPHIWLDPKRAIQQVENIRDGMIAVDPEGEEIYTANAAAFIAELEALDAEITEQLAPFAGQTFVAFHDFAPYFAESYNLQADFLVDVPAANAAPEDVKRVMDTVQASNLKTILTEPTAGEDAFDAIAQDLGVQVGVFNPLEVGDPESVQPDYYLTTMRQNAANLASAFETSTQSWLPLWQTQPVAVVPQAVGLRF
uniref:metal ABC transporter solute-binding protein, Zn/Mn family n=1 Tax=Petrachloros mirabilis TaxID=2918835 RepID=UPI001EE78B42|nr:zinc ABC transporter substrate-binding protein [Petrachloros mirabilis]